MASESNYYANSIELNDEFPAYHRGRYENESRKPLQELANLSRVNVFVGANNSGKSRFLRKLSTQLPSLLCIFKTEDIGKKDFVPYLEDLKENAPDGSYEVHTDTGRIVIPPSDFYLASPLRRTIGERKRKEFLDDIQDLLARITEMSISYRNLSDAQIALTELNDITSRLPTERNPSLYYLPVLRGLRPLETPPEDKFVTYEQAPGPYDDRTVSDYFEDAEHPPEVFTGEKLYWRVREMLLGEQEKRQKIRDFEDYLSENFFSLERERSVSLIPRTDDDVLFVKIGEEKEKPIYELGDGIQTIIILTFLAHTEEHAMFFIEEPDIFLHPGLQRRLIECFCDKREHQFFLTTHSNHLLDLTLDFDDISIFKFEKIREGSHEENRDPNFSIECVEDGDNSVLAQLGVRNSSVFLVNATIWVEGITDRMYLRHYFEKWQAAKKKENEDFTVYREDTHFAFVEYGGGNVGHFFDEMDDEDDPERPMDVERLSGRAFVIMDGDGERDDKLEKYENLPDEQLHVLQCREIENLLPKELLEAHIKRREGEFEFPEGIDWEDYRDVRLGEWIESEFDGELGYNYASDSGALRSDLKKKFAKWTADRVDAEDLTGRIEELMEQMYEHIERQHRHLGS